jgi:hypothetical protein
MCRTNKIFVHGILMSTFGYLETRTLASSIQLILSSDEVSKPAQMSIQAREHAAQGAPLGWLLDSEAQKPPVPAALW